MRYPRRGAFLRKQPNDLVRPVDTSLTSQFVARPMALIFISHSNLDRSTAAQMRDWLATQGIDSVFLDFHSESGVYPGESWERRLYDEVSRCSAILLILTRNWLESKWCFAEYTQCRALGKLVLPVQFEALPARSVANDLQHIRWYSDLTLAQERLLSQIHRIALASQSHFDWDPRRPPYPGLLSFQAEDAAIYYGRNSEIQQLIERLNVNRLNRTRKLVLLLGASGTGKSSLIRAGILPRLRWDTAYWAPLSPIRPGRTPVLELARCLALASGYPGDAEKFAAELLSNDYRVHLGHYLDKVRRLADSAFAQMLICIDQGEELFHLPREAQCARFIKLLSCMLTEHDDVTILMGLRSDALHDLQSRGGIDFDLDEYFLRFLPIERIPMPFDPVRSRKTLLDQEEAPVGGLTQVGNLKRCPAEVLWVTAGAKGIGMNRASPRHYSWTSAGRELERGRRPRCANNL